MVFSSEVFLGIFLPAVLLLYFLAPGRNFKNYIMLVASLFFYAWGEPIWVFSMIGLVLIDFIGGLYMEKLKKPSARRTLLILLIALNLLQLFVFKYLNFLIDNINAGFESSLPHLPFVMPIGISFFTFQALTYLVDVYRGTTPAQKRFSRLLLYIAMFPQLIAGPIVRYNDIAEQLSYRKETREKFAQGCIRFSVGLCKKVIFANYSGMMATSLLTNGLPELSASGAWVGILMFTFQIYFDFSGYSDMAIGLGKMFGFEFRENFNYPYISRTVTEFWRRWHISLGTFFRDYVYIPLGGNRRHQYLNIFIVWALTGFWHGADWNFLLWGLYYGVLLAIEKKLMRIQIDMGKVPVISNIVLLGIVMVGWAIFYYTDITQLKDFCLSLLGMNGSIAMSVKELSAVYDYFWLIPFMAAACTPLPAMLGRKIFGNGDFSTLFKAAAAAGMLALCYVLILGQSYNPFLYFRF